MKSGHCHFDRRGIRLFRLALSAVFFAALALFSSRSARAVTTIDPLNRYAWGANIGWINWYADGADGAVIGKNFCSGYIYSANVGWINLGSGSPANGVSYQNNSATDFGVNVDSAGNLRGFAWGANIGWINFEATGAPKMDLNTGQMSGYAWSANCGWINLNSGYGVQTETLYDGNNLGAGYGSVDHSPGTTQGAQPLVILGEYSPAGPLGTSTKDFAAGGKITDVTFYGDYYNFTLYVLEPVSSGPGANEQTFQVMGSESFSGTAATGIQILHLETPLSVSAGDLVAFAGTGPYYNVSSAVNSDATYENSSAPGSLTATPPGTTPFVVGLAGDASATYDYISTTLGRNYAIGINVTLPDGPTPTEIEPAETVVSTVPEWIAGGYNEISELGTAASNPNNTPTVGETFIAPASPSGVITLNSFTFYLQGQAGSQVTLQGEVFNWFGNLLPSGGPPFGPQGTTGNALYTSSPISYTASGGWDAITIQIPRGVPLVSGNPYVIDFTATGGSGNAVFGNTWEYLFGGLGAPTQGGGNFSNPPGTEFGAWNEPGFGFYGDLAFTANFSGGIGPLGTASRLEKPAAGSDSVVLPASFGSAGWTATVDAGDAGWLHPPSQPGSQTGASLVFNYDQNDISDANGGSTRTGTVTITSDGQTLTFTVTQAGSAYTYDTFDAPTLSVTSLVSSATFSPPLNTPSGVAADTAGNVYFADSVNAQVYQWLPNGTTTNLVSSPTGLSAPAGVAVDAADNVYVVDGNTIKEWSPGSTAFTNIVSALNNPHGVAVDSQGNVYIADAGNHAIEEWTPGESGFTTLVSGLGSPTGVAVDTAGNVYIADAGNHAIEEWTPGADFFTTLIPSSSFPSPSTFTPSALAVDGAGNVYVVDSANAMIDEWTAANASVTALVPASIGFAPSGVAVDGAGNVYIADTGKQAIEELPYALVDPATITETGSIGSDSLPAVLPTTANLSGPFAPTSDSTSWLRITGIGNGVVNFAFIANPTSSSRTGHITEFGEPVPVTQGPEPPSTPSSSCDPPPSGIVNWWPGEGNANDVVGGDNGIPEGDVTYTTGIDGQAFSFDGTCFLATSQEVNNPQNFTLECWFKTTTMQGGVLIGFSQDQSDSGGGYDRFIYMDDNGFLHFGVYNNGTYTADSTVWYNDGNWHHVAATLSATAGLSLYVDGILVGTNPYTTTAQNYNGWWRIGEDNIGGWPNQPSSSFFNGAIDEVSIYDRPLCAAEIQNIYNAGSNGKCEVSLGASSGSEEAAGGSSSITLNDDSADTAWMAAVNPDDASWLSVTTSSGEGSATIGYNYAADTGAARTGTITIAGQTFTVMQDGPQTSTTIDSVNRYAWGANIGWIDWYADGADGAVIGKNFCSGYIYSANTGWINLGSGAPANGVSYQNNSATDFGVNVDSAGNLRGFAWGANIGWINFEDTGAPKVNLNTGQMSGYAWSANCGWINLNSGYGVQTDFLYDGNNTGLPYGSVDHSPGTAQGAQPLVILGEYSPAGPLAASSITFPPVGEITDLIFYGDYYNFTLYVLAPVSSGPGANEQTFQVVSSESFSGSAATGIQTLSLATPLSVSAGDLVAFAGTGPYYNVSSAVNSDATYENSSAPGSLTASLPGTTPFVVGLAGDANATYDYISTTPGRNYAIGVDVKLPGSQTPTQLLVALPGQTFTSGAGISGTPLPQAAGVAFNACVYAVDANFNLITTASPTVTISSTDPNAVLPGPVTLAQNGTATGKAMFQVTLKTAGTQTVTTTDNPNQLAAGTSSAVTVNPGPVTQIQVVAPASATAGAAVNITVNAVDSFGNLIITASPMVTITSTDPNAAVPANLVPLSVGTAVFSVTFKTATTNIPTWTVTATDNANQLAPGTSSLVTVNPGPAVKLQVLLPGESAVPGTSTGKTGTPFPEIAGQPFNVTVNAVDAQFNLATTATPTVALAAPTDPNVVFPQGSTMALVNGSLTLPVTLNTPGAQTLTAIDTAQNNPLMEGESTQFSVNASNLILYVTCAGADTITKITAQGNISTFATINGGAAFNQLTGLAFDGYGNLDVGDIYGIYGDDTVEQVTPGGTADGIVLGGYSVENPEGLAFNNAANTVYVAGAGVIYKVAYNNGLPDLLARDANVPEGLAFNNESGILYVANENNNTVEELTTSGQSDGSLSGGLNNPVGLALDSSGNLYIANSGNSTLSKVVSGGSAPAPFVTSGQGLGIPWGVAVDGSGNVFVANTNNGTISEVTSSGSTVATFASGLSNPQWVIAAQGPVITPPTVAGGQYGQPVTFAASATGYPMPAITYTLQNGIPITSPYQFPTGTTTVNCLAQNFAGSASCSFTVTVSPAPLAITVNDESKPYGAGLPTPSFSYVGFVNGDTAASLTTQPTVTTTATAASPPGNYSITPGGAEDPNYTITYQAGTLTVGPAALTVTARAENKTYGQTSVFGGGSTLFTSSGLENGDTIGTVTLTVSGNGGAATSDVGNYTITPSLATGGTFNANNYNITYQPGTLTVGPATLTITANNQYMISGSSVPPLTVTYGGFVNGENQSVLGGTASVSTTATSASYANAAYPITVGIGSITDPNYNYQFVSGMVYVGVPVSDVSGDWAVSGEVNGYYDESYQGTIIPTNVAGTFNTGQAFEMSDAFINNYGANPAVEAAASISGNFQAVSSYASVDYSFEVIGPPNQPVPVLVTASGGGIAGPIIPGGGNSAAGQVVMGDADGNILANFNGAEGLPNASWPSTFSVKQDVSVLPNGVVGIRAAASVELYGAPANGFAYAGWPIVVIDPSFPQASQYTIVYSKSIPLPTTPADVVTWPAPSYLVYGNTVGSVLQLPTATVTGTFSYSPALDTVLPAGLVQPLTITFTPADTADYPKETNIVLISVLPAPLTITANSVAIGQGKIVPALTASYNGLVNGDTAATLNIAPNTPPTISTTATRSSAMGSYPITVTGASDPNYYITFVDGNVVVGPSTWSTSTATTAQAGQSATATLPSTSTQGGVTATLNNNASGSQPVTVSAAAYSGDPEPMAFGIGTASTTYLDVEAPDAVPGDSLTAYFYYPVIPGGAAPALLYFSDAGWETVLSDLPPPKAPTPVLQNGLWQYTVIFDESSTPPLSDLTGTVFALETAPTLYISLSGTTVTLSWQDAFGWTLQQNSSLSTNNWAPTTFPITTANGTNSISITSPTGTMFFQLTQP